MKILIALALVAGTALPAEAALTNWTKAQRVTVVMTNSGYAPRTVRLKSGGAYVMRFVNRSDRGHDFWAKDFLGNARVEPADGGKVTNNKLSVPAGSIGTLRLIAPTTPGAQYYFESKKLGDAASGYKGSIFVQ